MKGKAASRASTGVFIIIPAAPRVLDVAQVALGAGDIPGRPLGCPPAWPPGGDPPGFGAGTAFAMGAG